MPRKPNPKPKPDVSDGLLDDLKGVPDESLSEGVERTEGVNGSTLQPIYRTRRMPCYSVTESELKNIGLANFGTTASFGIGSALLAFALDIFKDTTLVGAVPKNAELVVNTVQPLLFIFGAVFWVVAGCLVYWRHDMIKSIKRDSE